ncbi:TetR/AcrR family transcriptional regulator [Amphibacillus cookii]|uniref:TetR/AcrR family transcriptional regulator n=1 Tax=Amphibacillus cookii TaxID=767787 RepID=UPI001958725C|nr:TetR/AcrR family transcriptional regulator [Amphibacillus cookii]MBM7541330.1 AcrR family transcriptional regulator [Amphibacillus cookii]
MSANKIKVAALSLFAERGYDGTSLALIAEQIGIKKQSIYAHFKGKEDLFLSLLTETFTIELEREEQFLEQYYTSALDTFLKASLASFLSRYNHDNRLKFWLKNTFLPPIHLYDKVNRQLNRYIHDVESLYIKRFETAVSKQEISMTNPQQANLAFSALIDSVAVELIYGDQQRATAKMEASWEIYWKGLTATNRDFERGR